MTNQAALHCADCAAGIAARLAPPPNMQPRNESTWDSDDYPKGPYTDGGGEADSPQHCDTCGVFLENPLTADGYAYVRDAVSEAARRIASQSGPTPSVAFDTWRPFYEIEPGVTP